MADAHVTTPRSRGDTDAPHMSPVTPAEDARTILLNRISLGAVLAGVVTALVIHLILNLIGIGIGVATLDPGLGNSPEPRTFSIAAAAWWTGAGIVASLVGGYVAGRMSGQPKESTAGLHGFTSWAATTLVIVYLLTTAVGGLLGGVFNALGNVLGGLGGTAAQVVETAAPVFRPAADPFSAVERQIRDATGGNDPAAWREAAVAAIRTALTGDQAQAPQARERAAEALARVLNTSVEEARARVQQYEQQYRAAADQLRQEGRQAAETAATAVSTAALVGAGALLLGALAGWLGGRWGAVDPTITTARMAAERRS